MATQSRNSTERPTKPATCPAEVRTGFDGKLPSRGDFVERGLPQSFLSPWRSWMDAALLASRAALGDAWLPLWLEAPVWHFALPGGLCGPDSVLGLWFPSVDTVDRHYPLTVAAVFVGQMQAPGGQSGLAWLDAVQELALDALAFDHPPDVLEQAIQALPTCDFEPGGPQGCWWTEVSPRASAVRRALDGLPDHDTFVSMLGGAV
jgi:type VI secretion system protein ImpM